MVFPWEKNCIAVGSGDALVLGACSLLIDLRGSFFDYGETMMIAVLDNMIFVYQVLQCKTADHYIQLLGGGRGLMYHEREEQVGAFACV